MFWRQVFECAGRVPCSLPAGTGSIAQGLPYGREATLGLQTPLARHSRAPSTGSAAFAAPRSLNLATVASGGPTAAPGAWGRGLW